MNRRVTGDKIRVAEKLHDGYGRLLAESEGHKIVGEVEVIYSGRKGNRKIFTRSFNENDLLLTGAVFLSEKLNDMRSTFITNPIDVTLGVHSESEIDFSSATVGKEKVCGIMVGNGGAGDTYNTIHRVNRMDKAVPGMVPFRVVPVGEDLTGAVRNKYILRVVQNGYAWYYGKKFETEPEINVIYEDGRIISPTTSPTGDTSSNFIKTFTKYTAVVDAEDIRQYFLITEGSTLRSLINSVGLMTGYPGTCIDTDETVHEEFFNVRGMTTLNMENNELKDDEATLTFVYRLYIA